MGLNSFKTDKLVDDLAAEKSLMCQAHECPNRWSVDTGSKLCSAHAWADPSEWRHITHQEISKVITRQHATPKEVRPISEAEKRQILQNLRDVLKSPKDPKAWAHKLREREQNGEQLSGYQKQAWREALKTNEL